MRERGGEATGTLMSHIALTFLSLSSVSQKRANNDVFVKGGGARREEKRKETHNRLNDISWHRGRSRRGLAVLSPARLGRMQQ